MDFENDNIREEEATDDVEIAGIDMRAWEQKNVL